jgi:uncharacterized membrane protein YkvA (DUF1232 family)
MSRPSYRPNGWNLSAILSDLQMSWRLVRDPAVPTLLKLLLPVLAILYFISPLDLLPGLVFDDIAVLILAARLFVSMAPQASVNRAYYGDNPSTSGRPRQPDGEDDGEVIDTTWRVID